MSESINRRDFIARGLKGLAGLGLASGLGAALLPREARAEWGPDPMKEWRDSIPKVTIDESDPNVFVMSRFRFQTITRVTGQWDAGLVGDENLLAFLRTQTNLRVTNLPTEARVVGIDDFAKMRKNPFLFMTSEGRFAMTKEEAEAIGEFFKRGGFIYADDCVDGEAGVQFYTAYQEEIQKTLPGFKMEPVAPDHEIYRCFFRIPGGRSPICQGVPHPDMGLFYNGRMVSFLTAGDVHCGWVPWHGPEKMQECFRMGTNIVIYALTH